MQPMHGALVRSVAFAVLTFVAAQPTAVLAGDNAGSGPETPSRSAAAPPRELPRWQRLFDEVDRLAYEQKTGNTVALAREAFALAERDQSADPLHLARRLNYAGWWLGEVEPEAAPPLLERALALRRSYLPEEHAEVADTLENLGTVNFYLRRLGEAKSFFMQALVIRSKLFGERSFEVSDTLHDLGLLHLATGDYKLSEDYFVRAKWIREHVMVGPAHTQLAWTLADYSIVLRDTGRLKEAEALAERSIAIHAAAQNREQRMVALTLERLGLIYQMQGKLSLAVSAFDRSNALTRMSLGDEHWNLASGMNNLAVTYRLQGRLTEAEALYRDSIARYERAVGAEHTETIKPLANLAAMYAAEGRYSSAEPLLLRAMFVYEKASGTQNPEYAEMLGMFAGIRRGQQRYEEAAALLERALSSYEESVGKGNQGYAGILRDLAALRELQGRRAEAESLYLGALSILSETVGREHPDCADAMLGLARMYRDAGQPGRADQVVGEALSILAATLGLAHPSYAAGLRELAEVRAAQGRPQEALVAAREATAIEVRSLTSTGRALHASFEGPRPQQVQFAKHVLLLSRFDPTSVAESFELAQWSRSGDVAAQVAQMAARYAAGTDRLAQEVRARQDLSAQVDAIDAELLRELSRPSNERQSGRATELRAEQARLMREVEAADVQLTTKFPRYRSLVDLRPLAISEAQKLLRPGEALVSYLLTDDGCFVWVVRAGVGQAASFKRLSVTRADIERHVSVLRSQLQAEGLAAGSAAGRFDLKVAHELYLALLAPVASHLNGVKVLLVVPHGTLHGLPFSVLTTAPPTPDGSYAGAAWLIRRYALATLPSENSLRALRAFAVRADSGTEPASAGRSRERLSRELKPVQPLVGFGDPLLSEERAREIRAGDAGESAWLDELLQLQRLPDTSHELRSLAALLDADPAMIHLGEAATEAAVKKTSLDRFRIVAFATHGLMAGDLSSLREAALVMTPPLRRTADDDGLLTATEIAELRMSADWVILSACNTASSGDRSGSEGFSGLARAFFYAGARSMLVSHWPVESRSAVALTTASLRHYASGANKAEALRRAMLELIQRGVLRAHPAYWAPFVVVGENSGAR